MKAIERVLIVGPGAVGSAVASIIHKQVPGSVSVLADGERFDRYSRDGFIINGEHFSFPVVSPHHSSNSRQNKHAFDLIIVAVKNHHLSQAMEQMRPHVGPDTTVLSLLNGISSEETLGNEFGPGPGAPEGCSIPPYAMILGIDAVRVANETCFASSGKIFFGDAQNKTNAFSPRIERIASFFDKAKVPYTIPENMLRSLWYKFMINVGINQASAVLRAPYRAFQSNPDARSLMESLQREVITVSQAHKVNLDESDLSRWEETLSKLHPENMTSMCQDVLAERKTEVEIFAGAVMELGQRYSVETPVNTLMFTILKGLEASYQRT